MYSRGVVTPAQDAFAKNPLFQPGPGVHEKDTLVTGMTSDGNLLGQHHVGADVMSYDRRHEAALAPLLESIRSNQSDPVYAAFAAQLDKLYQAFRDLHEQDQVEIRHLLATLETQKQHLQQLATENATVRKQIKREREQSSAALSDMEAKAKAASSAAAVASAAVVAAANSNIQYSSGGQAGVPPLMAALAPPDLQTTTGRRRLDDPTQPPQLPGGAFPPEGPLDSPEGPQGSASRRARRWQVSERGGGTTSDTSDMPEPNRRGSRGQSGKRPYLVLFLPYMLHPAHHCWRFFAAWQYSWTTRRTAWLAVAWVLVFLLAVGLLVGLLVPWDNLTDTEFTTPPTLVAVNSTQASVVVQLNREATVYYAVVPQVLTAAPSSKKRLLLFLGGGDGAPDTTSPSSPPSHRARDSDGRHRTAFGPGSPPSWLGLRWPRGGVGEPGDLAAVRSALHSRTRQLASSSGLPPLLRLEDLQPDDVRAIAEGDSDEEVLFPYAVACGVVTVPLHEDQNYTLTVSSISQVPPSGGVNATEGPECFASFGLLTNSSVPLSTGKFRARRCQRCPFLLPSTAYVMLLMGDGGRASGVMRVNFTTTPAG